MKTFIKVIARSVDKVSATVFLANADGSPTTTGAKYATLTLSKDAIRLEAHPLTGEMMVVRALPTTVSETQWLSACVTGDGLALRRGLIADAQIGEHIEGDILKLGAADGVDPYTGSRGSAYEDNTYTNTNVLFIGEFDQDSAEFGVRVDKAVDRFNTQMARQHRVAVTV